MLKLFNSYLRREDIFPYLKSHFFGNILCPAVKKYIELHSKKVGHD